MSAIGGPLLFLVGTILFKHSFRGFLQLSHGVGIIALGGLAWFAGGLSPLMLSILTTAIMIVVAVWESISLRSGAEESTPPKRANGGAGAANCPGAIYVAPSSKNYLSYLAMKVLRGRAASSLRRRQSDQRGHSIPTALPVGRNTPDETERSKGPDPAAMG